MAERTDERDVERDRGDVAVDVDAVTDVGSGDLPGDDRGSTEGSGSGEGGLRNRLGLDRLRDRSPGATGEVGTDAGNDAATGTDQSAERSGSRLPLVGGRLFSVSAFLASLVLMVGGAVAAGTLLPWGGAGAMLGVLVAATVVGLGTERSRYVESVAAGAVTAGVATFLSSVALTVATAGAPVAFGVGAGAVAGLVGHYAGRDLRDGLTRDL